MLVLFVALLLALPVVAHRLGYAAGHTDAWLEREGHQPISHHGRKLHRHLTSYDGGAAGGR